MDTTTSPADSAQPNAVPVYAQVRDHATLSDYDQGTLNRSVRAMLFGDGTVYLSTNHADCSTTLHISPLEWQRLVDFAARNGMSLTPTVQP